MASTGSVLCVVLLSALLFAVSVHSTAVKKCRDADKLQGEIMKVEISNCEVAPCILKKNTTSEIMIRFKPQQDVKEVRNKVFAKLAGIPLPFLGVDGKLSCKHVFEADGVTQAGCPLTADKEYVYKNSFDIMAFYPMVSPTVHWGLVDSDTRQYVVCFEVQAKITAQ